MAADVVQRVSVLIAADDASSHHDDSWTLVSKGDARLLVAEVIRLRDVLDDIYQEAREADI